VRITVDVEARVMGESELRSAAARLRDRRR